MNTSALSSPIGEGVLGVSFKRFWSTSGVQFALLRSTAHWVYGDHTGW